jgi:Na+/proline symporter
VAAHFAARPDARREGFLAWMSAATLWATLAGVTSDVAATLYHTASVADADERGRLVLEGLAESMSPAIVGFALLALVAMLVAVGRRRFEARRT